MITLAKLCDPARWQNYFRRRGENHRRHLLDKELEVAWTERGPATVSHFGKRTLIADGMWYNPNHFLRLRLFIGAAAADEEYHLLAVLRRRDDTRERQALERIGFRDFLYLEEDEEFSTSGFLFAADRLLEGVDNPADFLDLKLPDDLPAYVVYDTVLKIAQSPQPPMDHPQWRICLAEALRDLAIYRRELDNRDVAHVALSHPWKNEWATLVWLAVGRSVPTYHLTGFVEAMRIRRFRSRADFRNPVEHLPYEEFVRLPREIQARISRLGAEQLRRRATGESSDINARYAYRPEQRITERERARRALGSTGQPIAVVYSHVWYDFPHTFGMSNFTDFRDWMDATLARIRNLPEVQWLLRPHPTEEWYGGFRLAEMAINLPEHVTLLTSSVDNQTVLTAADCVVTVHGTVAMEAAAAGLPVILGDRSYFSDWGFAHAATSRSHYFELLDAAGALAAPSDYQRDLARAAFALALGQPPEGMGALPMICDSQGVRVHEQVLQRATGDTGLLAAEQDRISRFLDQTAVDSFAAFHLLEFSRTAASLQTEEQNLSPAGDR